MNCFYHRNSDRRSATWHGYSRTPRLDETLAKYVRELGRRLVKKVLAAIDQNVEGFLQEALQIAPQQVATQLKAEELGYL